jgi:hypothetical protein
LTPSLPLDALRHLLCGWLAAVVDAHGEAPWGMGE